MKLRVLLGALALGASISAQAAMLQVTVTNVAEDSDFFLTPLWIGIHNGQFDLFDPETTASPGLELLAEEGNPSILSQEFVSATGGQGVEGFITNPAGFGGAPVLDPDETGTITLTIDDTMLNQFFSFASMVIPSNDSFIGNGNPEAYRIFNDDGTFANPGDIEIFARDIWDSGTEVNDPNGGAAFSALGGMGVDENGLVRLDGRAPLFDFLGTGTVAGTMLGSAPGPDALVARISFQSVSVPEPGSLALMGLGALGLSLRRKFQRR